MTTLVTGDLHLTDQARDSYRHDFQKQLRGMIRKHGVDTLVVLGDLCEAKDRHAAWLVNKIVEYFHELAGLCDVIVLKGNHDYRSADWPYWRFLGRLRGVMWVNEQEVIELPGIGRCMFLPHAHDYLKEWDLKFGGYAYIFAHNTFEDAETESGHRLRGIPLNTFPERCRLISGDIHTPQEFGCLRYVGAPYTIDFGDDYVPRVLLLTRDRVQSIPCPGRQKRLVEHDSVLPTRPFTNLHAGDLVKIRVHLRRSEYDNWAEIKADWLDWGDRMGLVVHQVQPVVERIDPRVLPVGRDLPKSDAERVRMYAKTQGVSEATAKTGLAIIKE